MCLLITQPAGTVFDKNFLDDVYGLNSDGVGVMYAENGKVYVTKALPKNEAEALQFYDEHIKGRACAAHYRMRTHGATDILNCHPYQIISADEGVEMWMMHNGVLHTGNGDDVTKSDTWHYIQDVLRPMLLANPAFINHPAFATLVGDHIGGGNKFTLLDALGNMVTVNEDQGVRFNGAWLSNTYAWNSKSQKYVSCRPPTPTYMGYGTGYGASYGVSARDKRYSSDSWDDDEYAEKYTLVSPIGLLNKQAQSAKNGLDDDGWSSEEDFVGALFEYIDASYVMGDADRFGYGMVRTYYETVGDDAAWDLIDTLENFAIDADTLVDILDRKLLHIDLVTV